MVLARGLPGKTRFFGDVASELRMFPIGAKKEAGSDSSGDDSRGRNHWKGNYGLPWGRVPVLLENIDSRGLYKWSGSSCGDEE